MPISQADGYAEQKEEIYAIDFDKTLAAHDSGKAYDHRSLGEPIMPMVEKVHTLLDEGKLVVIFTARVNPGITYEHAMQATESYLLIAQWCKQYLGQVVPICYAKSPGMVTFIDDRARQVVPNEGYFVDEVFPPVTQ